MSAEQLDAEIGRIAMIFGSDAQSDVQVTPGTQVTATGISDFNKLWTRNGAQQYAIHITPNYFRQPRRPRLEAFDCIINLVTDADRNPKVLEVADRLLRDYKGRVINRPARVAKTTRDGVARLLQGIPGLIVPPVARLRGGRSHSVYLSQLAKAGVQFPAIVRAAGTHTGRVLGVFRQPEDVLPALVGNRDYYATRFANFRSPDALYRKYRVFMIDGKPVLRHMLAGDSWDIHAANRNAFMADRADLQLEEARLMGKGFSPQVRDVFAAIHQRMGLDYFGIDFTLTPDEHVILFEANATMNFFPFSELPCFDYVERCRPTAERAVDMLLYPNSQSVSA
jgi:hypothetical protein